MTRYEAIALIFLLAGCAGPAAAPAPAPLMPPPGGGGQARTDAETAAACRQRAEQIYDIQHRGDIYTPTPETNSPFASNYRPGAVPTQNLSALHEHDRLIDDCIRNTGAESNLPGH